MKDKTVLGHNFGSDSAQVFAVGLADGTELASAACRKSCGSAGRLSKHPCQSTVGLGVDAMRPIRARVAKGEFECDRSSRARIAAASSADLIRPSHFRPGFCISCETRNTVGRSGFLNNRNRVRCVLIMPQRAADNNEGAK